jgi:RecA-family ATPase
MRTLNVENFQQDMGEPISPVCDGSEAKTGWIEVLQKATLTPKELGELAIPRRQPIVGGWFMQGDLGFIFGQRGLGKTWLAQHLARRIAEGGRVAEWSVPQPRKVLYVDGEMAFDAIRERDIALSEGATENLLYLQHEALFHSSGSVLNLTCPSAQEALLEICRTKKVDVLILDNLSCLFSGIKENDADAWELVLPWLLEFRRRQIAVVFVAHAGRNGNMRGTSRREDAAFWVIQLTEAMQTSDIQNGARFNARFVKNRNATEEECPRMEWHFHKPTGQEKAEISSRPLSTIAIFRELVETGLTSATDIAEEMGSSKGQVSKLANKGIQEGWLKKEGRDYALTGKS